MIKIKQTHRNKFEVLGNTIELTSYNLIYNSTDDIYIMHSGLILNGSEFKWSSGVSCVNKALETCITDLVLHIAYISNKYNMLADEESVKKFNTDSHTDLAGMLIYRDENMVKELSKIANPIDTDEQQIALDFLNYDIE